MHLRDKHFHQNGTEIDAPQYVYYDKLLFMTDFSIKKYPNASVTSRTTSQTETSTAISPDLLIYEQIKDSRGNQLIQDLTVEFIEAVKEYPCLYDENAELRKYRSNVAWKAIENKFGGKFTVGKLRSFWMQVVKKYKYYMNNYETLSGQVDNEHIFEKLYFVSVKNYNQNDVTSIVTEDEFAVVEDDEEQSQEMNDNYERFIIESEEPPLKKKIKIIEKETVPPPPISTQQEETLVFNTCTPAKPMPIAQPSKEEDEYDLFGKKVAIQLREIAMRSKNVARKGEIKVLQLLMDLDESIE